MKGIKILPGKKLIWYRFDFSNTTDDLVNEINDYMRENTVEDSRLNWLPCSSSNFYNYHSHGPCVFLIFDEKFSETPDYYTYDMIPNDAPQYLQKYMKDFETREEPKRGSEWGYLTCEGQYPADIENIGPIQYFPSFQVKLPITSQVTNPFAAILFERPIKGVLIGIECKIWAKFKTNKDMARSSVKFDILVE
ncbi:hypothetical protein FQA39_LY15642 [Lamprigera yunnana]|nr:hypothetical protein FQA39_LY15642 [Lamprigera yunnana]